MEFICKHTYPENAVKPDFVEGNTYMAKRKPSGSLELTGDNGIISDISWQSVYEFFKLSEFDESENLYFAEWWGLFQRERGQAAVTIHTPNYGTVSRSNLNGEINHYLRTFAIMQQVEKQEDNWHVHIRHREGADFRMLSDLTNEYQRISSIRFNKDGNSISTSKILLQHVTGCIYKGVDVDKDRQPYCDLYIYSVKHDIAVWFESIYYSQDKYVEEIFLMSQRNGLASAEGYIAMLDRRAERDQYINLAQIEFAQYVAPERVEVYRIVRQNCIEKQRLKDIKEREEQEQREKERQAGINRKALEKLVLAANIIANGGKLENQDIELYADGDYREYKMVNYIARLYGVKIPLKTQGWINERLTHVVIKDSKVAGYYRTKPRRGKGTSDAFFAYFNEVIQAVKADTGLEKIKLAA